MMRPSMIRMRAIALLSAALATCGVLAAGAPAQALTWDHDRTNSFHFSVAGKQYLLSEVAIGHQRTIQHVGQHSGTVWSRWRITIEDDHGKVLHRVDRHVHKETAIVAALSGDGFRTVQAFEAAEHRALTITEARARKAYFKGLRLESIDADQESSIGRVLDYLHALPTGAKPDFDDVTPIHSDEYRGSVTVSGSDAGHWSVIVRDTQDGVGSFYDSATGSGTRFPI